MKEQWLEQGYEDFAIAGPDQLSINQIAKRINASRSTFYHYFGDIHIFIDRLLEQHWEVSVEFDSLGKTRCKRMIPDLYDTLSEYTIPLQFSRQLFINRHIPRYNYLFEKAYESSAKAFGVDLFAAHLELDLPREDLLNLYRTLGEAWYSRLDPEDLSSSTMQRHSEEVMASLSSLIKSDFYRAMKRLG